MVLQALDVNRQAASAAYSTLQCILRPGSMSPKMMALNRALVARMDGVQQCCCLLCPVFSPQDAVATCVGEQIFCCLLAFCEAKCLFVDALRRTTTISAQTHIIFCKCECYGSGSMQLRQHMHACRCAIVHVVLAGCQLPFFVLQLGKHTRPNGCRSLRCLLASWTACMGSPPLWTTCFRHVHIRSAHRTSSQAWNVVQS